MDHWPVPIWQLFIFTPHFSEVKRETSSLMLYPLPRRAVIAGLMQRPRCPFHCIRYSPSSDPRDFCCLWVLWHHRKSLPTVFVRSVSQQERSQCVFYYGNNLTCLSTLGLWAACMFTFSEEFWLNQTVEKWGTEGEKHKNVIYQPTSSYFPSSSYFDIPSLDQTYLGCDTFAEVFLDSFPPGLNVSAWWWFC